MIYDMASMSVPVAEIQPLQTEESDAAAQVASEQARWAEINQRLEELDRALARVPDGRVRRFWRSENWFTGLPRIGKIKALVLTPTACVNCFVPSSGPQSTKAQAQAWQRFEDSEIRGSGIEDQGFAD